MKFQWFAVVLAMIFQQCAQVGPLSGGKRDTDPPVLLDAIPLNRTVNFNSEVILLKFDEFVQLKELNNQLIISPKIKTPPEIAAEGRNIRITLKKDELRPSTTYRFFFGKAIADMHESNSLMGFEYVFSTGAHIDTLNISGFVSDASNNKPAGNVLVGLYAPESADSVAWQDTPDYFSRTSESGEFKLNNIPPGSFKVIAIADKNKNGLYDGESEKVAFLDDRLTIEKDSNITLRLFQEEIQRVFLKKTVNPYFGLTQLLLNKKARIDISTLHDADSRDIYEIFKGAEKDTISVYYRNIEDTLKLVVDLQEQKTDTLIITLPPSKTFRKKLRTFQLNTQNNNIAPGEPLRITFPVWMDTTRFMTNRISIIDKEDTTKSARRVTGHWHDVRQFVAEGKLAEGHRYQLKADTGAFYDLRGVTNDSSTFHFRAQSRLDFGKVTLNMKLNRKQCYVVQLINEQQLPVREDYIELSLSSSNAVSIEFTDVPPGTYNAKVIFDDNKNRKWDTGNLLKKRQPEKAVINSKQLKILADWEIEEEIVVKD